MFAFTDLAVADATIRAVSRRTGVSVRGPALLGLSHPINIAPPTASAFDVSDLIVGTAVQVGHLR